MNATLASNESPQRGRLFLRIALVCAAWIAAPYIVYAALGSDAGNGAAALGLAGWVMAVLVPVMKHARRPIPGNQSVYVSVLCSFVIGLACTALYLWLCD
jgi:hypothetical protein